MERVTRSTKTVTKPALPVGEGVGGYFTGGDPGTGIPATQPGYEWFNRIQEEIANAILAAGLFLDKTNDAQLSQAIPLLAVTNILGQNNAWLKAQRGGSKILGYAASQNIDISTAQHFELTLTGNPLMNNPTAMVAGQEGTITFIQDATGSRAPSGWGSYWSFEDSALPNFTATPTKKDTFAYFVRGSNEIVLKLAVRNY